MGDLKQFVKKGFCSFCEHTGILRNPKAYIMGEDALSPCTKCVIPQCKCNGVEPFYYPEDGQIKECSCRQVRLKIGKINALYSQSGIEKKYCWRFLNEFNCTNKQAEKAKTSAYDIICNYPTVDKGLFLWGKPGTGKTLLSAIILTELITRHALPGKFVKISRNFFGKIRSTFVEGSELYGMGSKIEQELAEIDILVIDDFGIQRDSAWEQETLYNLVDARYETEKFTIFTSNLNPEETMKDLSQGRILSRIKEMCHILELSGKDYRAML